MATDKLISRQRERYLSYNKGMLDSDPADIVRLRWGWGADFPKGGPAGSCRGNIVTISLYHVQGLIRLWRFQEFTKIVPC